MGVLVYFKILICNFIICSLAKEKRENVDFGYVFERTHTEIFHVFFESLKLLRPVPPRLFFPYNYLSGSFQGVVLQKPKYIF